MNKPVLGIKINEASAKVVSLSRVTLESHIDLRIEDAKKRPYEIQTGIKFFNHMLTSIASRACLNLDVSYKATSTETLDHVIVEDIGLTLGRAVREILDARRKSGVMERGSSTITFDEALVTVTLAFDGRAYSFLRGDALGVRQEYVEDVLSTNLKQFFDGFAQGSGCVVQVQFWSGEDSHHTWEAAFKAFGEAIRESLLPCPYRAGTTIGLKGTGMETKL